MIKYKHDDIFETTAEAIVNTVNCVGVMGRGIALQFKNRFPENFDYYANACKKKEVMPGKMLVFDTGNVVNPRYIINFPTKRHWRGASRMGDITAGLKALAEEITSLQIKSVAIPPLGCGLGGLDWTLVKAEISNALGMIPNVIIEVYEPGQAPAADKMVSSVKVPNMTQGRAALVTLIQQYLNGLLDPVITLLEVHKLLYFLQESGEPLRLEYVKQIYGPYACNLRHVLNHIEGYFLSGYADGGDNPRKQLQLVSGASENATAFLQTKLETTKRISRVETLIEGFESPFGMELLATIHWLIKHENCTSLAEITQATYAWNDHKKQFSPRQIELAASRLMRCGWVPPIEGVK